MACLSRCNAAQIPDSRLYSRMAIGYNIGTIVHIQTILEVGMEIVIANEVPILRQSEVRAGATLRQILLAGDTPEGINFRLFRSQYQAGENAFESPRHHHAFQQI